MSARSHFRMSATIAIVAFAVIAGAVPSSADPAPNAGTFASPITFDGHLAMVNGVMVDGKGPYSFILDTGASGSARVSERLAKDLNLSVVDHVQGRGLGPDTLSLPVVQASISVGGLHFDDVRAAVHDISTRSGTVVDGVLGFDLFKDYLLTIDYPAGTISIAPGKLTPGESGVTAMTMEHGIPHVSGQIAGSPVSLAIDTGSGGGFGLSMAYESQLPFVARPKQVGQAVGAGGTVNVDAGQVNGDFIFGDQALHDPVVEFLPIPDDGILGYRLLQNYAVTFDQADQLVRFVAKPSTSPQ